MSHHKKQEHHIRPYKLLAQSFGLLVCGFIVLFIIGEGMPDIVKGNGDGLIPFLPLVLLPVAGYIGSSNNDHRCNYIAGLFYG